jgi:hypothetical protein
MSFEVKITGLEQFTKKLEKMSEQLKELHHAWPDELVAWQRDDMHRKFPNVRTDTSGDETATSTEIWPHSRLEAQDQRARRQGQRGPKQAAPKLHRLVHAGPKQRRGPEPRSTRPILRDELVQKLHDRMIRLATEAMKWP